jgi:hypothetical protein
VARRRLEAWRAVRQARRFSRACQAPIRVCWDLDNTLVGSGVLIHAGSQLEDAIVEAEPVPNMLDLFWSIREKLPHAGHFVVSARFYTMRDSTFVWLRRHGLDLDRTEVALVPDAEAKARVWEELARDGRLLIVDDLSYDHASDRPAIYEDLVTAARATASAYIGLDQIAEVSADRRAVDRVASRAAESMLGRHG